MDTVCRPFARNNNPKSVPYTQTHKPPGLAPHYRDTAQETRLSDNLVQPRPRYNHGVRALKQRCVRVKTFVGGGAHPNERRAVAKANRVRKPRGCSAERAG